MRFIDLTGRIHNKEISGYKYGIRSKSKSKGQKHLGEKLKELFPLMEVLEELPCFGTGLFLDFYIPGIKMAFEYDGRQHDEFVPFFHGDRQGYGKSVKNDVTKSTWIEKNGIILVRVNEETLPNLKELINERRK